MEKASSLPSQQPGPASVEGPLLKESGVPSPRQSQVHTGPLLGKAIKAAPGPCRADDHSFQREETQAVGPQWPLGGWEDHGQNPDFPEILCENSGVFPLL